MNWFFIAIYFVMMAVAWQRLHRHRWDHVWRMDLVIFLWVTLWSIATTDLGLLFVMALWAFSSVVDRQRSIRFLGHD